MKKILEYHFMLEVNEQKQQEKRKQAAKSTNENKPTKN